MTGRLFSAASRSELNAPRWAGKLAVALSFSVAPLWAESLTELDQAPGIFLEHATPARARALALDAALMKGWRVASGTADSSVFETSFTETQIFPTGEALTVPVRLFIQADFVPQGGGVWVLLRATEIRRQGARAEVQADVTDSYRRNLDNALGSLRSQWEDLALGGRPDQSNQQGQGTSQYTHHGSRATRSAPDAQPLPVGQWSYEAEQLARQHGCLLSDRGAVLVGGSASAVTERIRIHCQNRAPLVVSCSHEGCATTP